jgi:hypothetical protein
MPSAYELVAAKTKAYYEENYMNVVDPVSNVKMAVLKDMGKMLIKLGWEVVTNRPIDVDNFSTASESEEDTYYDDSIDSSVTERITTAASTMLPPDLIKEMSTEGAFTDKVTEVISDLVSSTNSTVSMWDGLLSDGAQVASLIGENVANVTGNLAGEIMRINTTDVDHEDSSLFLKSFRNYTPAVLPGPAQISLLLLIASAAMLCAS